MATYVLVHGAWHGGWCWRDVRQRLQQAGHTVFTPTLTGLGERSHLLSPDIDFETHVLDIMNVIEWEELEDVILVGHSYGGHVVTAVADRLKDRLRHVIYLDAHISVNGESTTHHRARLANPGASAEELEEIAQQRKNSAGASGGLTSDYPTMFDIPESETELYNWVARRITPHPIGSMMEPVRLENGGSDGLKRTYILCTGISGRSPFMDQADGLRDDPTWRVLELPTGHDAMVTMPEELTRLFLELDGQP